MKKTLATAAVVIAAAMSLTGCVSEAPADLNPQNAMSKNWEHSYLKVNDKSVICYNKESNYSVVCEWVNVTIPNGVEIVELNNETPRSGRWKLSYIVTANNETVPCIQRGKRLGSCDFKTNQSEGGYGESLPSASPSS